MLIFENIDINKAIPKNIDIGIDIDKAILKHIDINIVIDKGILQNIDIDINKTILKNIDTDTNKEIWENIDIDRISNRLQFGISNRVCASYSGKHSASIKVGYVVHLLQRLVVGGRYNPLPRLQAHTAGSEFISISSHSEMRLVLT